MQTIAVSNVTAWDAELYTSLGNDPQLIATSHTYSIVSNGVQYQDLSIGRLLMLICIARSEVAEAILQNEMELLERQTDLLDSSCQAMELLTSGGTVKYSTSFTYTDVNGSHTTTFGDYLKNVLQISNSDFYPNVVPWGETILTEMISGVKSRQDELNTITQKTSINIKDLVTKRDQANLLGTNALKRLMKDMESTTYNF